MTIIKQKLKTLDFYFIEEIRDGIWEITYAKDIGESENTSGEILYDYSQIAFWSLRNCDHRMVINFRNILLKNLLEGA